MIEIWLKLLWLKEILWFLNLKFDYIVLTIENFEDLDFMTVDQFNHEIIASLWSEIKEQEPEKLKQVLKTKLTFKDNEENFGNEKVKIIVL